MFFPIAAKPIPQVQNLAEQFPPKSGRPIVGIQSQGNGFQECIKAASLQQENTIPNTNRGREECRQGSTGRGRIVQQQFALAFIPQRVDNQWNARFPPWASRPRFWHFETAQDATESDHME